MLENLSINGWSVGIALLVLLLAFWGSRIVRRSVARLLLRVGGLSGDLKRLVARLSGYTVILIGLGIALSVLGVQTQPLITVALVVAAVAFLAVRGISDNFAAGIIIQTQKPVHIDDEIDALGYVGIVQELNSRAVVIRTYDGRTVHLPNKQVLENALVNNSVHGARRSEAEIRLVGAPDPGSTQDLVLKAVSTADGVLKTPAPELLTIAWEEDRLTLHIRFWHDPLLPAPAQTAVVQAIGQAMRQVSINATVIIPPPKPPFTPVAAV